MAEYRFPKYLCQPGSPMPKGCDCPDDYAAAARLLADLLAAGRPVVAVGYEPYRLVVMRSNKGDRPAWLPAVFDASPVEDLPGVSLARAPVAEPLA